MVSVPFTTSTPHSVQRGLKPRQVEGPNDDDPVTIIGKINTGNTVLNVSLESNGTETVTELPYGDPFAGRMVGGGTRDIIYGTKWYGSGYPDRHQGKGTAGRDLPFFFWPIQWGFSSSGPAYVYHDGYGRGPRPGGPQEQAMVRGKRIDLRVLSDELTTQSLAESIQNQCQTFLSGSITTRRFFAMQVDTLIGGPRPDQVIQYYRASSVALTLDQHNGNNTEFLSTDEDVEASVLMPLNYPEHELIDCVNRTIGERVPLVVPMGGISGEPYSTGMQMQPNIWSLWALGLVWLLSHQGAM